MPSFDRLRIATAFSKPMFRGTSVKSGFGPELPSVGEPATRMTLSGSRHQTPYCSDCPPSAFPKYRLKCVPLATQGAAGVRDRLKETRERQGPAQDDVCNQCGAGERESD